jgi:hypothetical protein
MGAGVSDWTAGRPIENRTVICEQAVASLDTIRAEVAMVRGRRPS